MVQEITTYNEFNHEINNRKGLIVVDYYADWCGPCKRIAPLIMKWDSEMNNVTFLKVNVEQNSRTALEMDIKLMPTFHLFINGRKIAGLKGANSNQLFELIDAYR